MVASSAVLKQSLGTDADIPGQVTLWFEPSSANHWCERHYIYLDVAHG